MLAWIARPCIKLSKTRLSTRHSCISEPQEDSLDGEQHFHPLALSLSQSLCFDHSEAVGFRLLSIRRLTVSLKLSHKLLVQFGVCYTYSTKTALSYLHLTTVTSFNNSTDVHGQACSSESRGCEKKKWPPSRFDPSQLHTLQLSSCFQGPMAVTFTQRRKRRLSWIVVEQRWTICTRIYTSMWGWIFYSQTNNSHSPCFIAVKCGIKHLSKMHVKFFISWNIKHT